MRMYCLLRSHMNIMCLIYPFVCRMIFRTLHIHYNDWKHQYFHFSIDSSGSIYTCDTCLLFTENTISTRRNVTTTFEREKCFTVNNLKFWYIFKISVEINLIWLFDHMVFEQVTKYVKFDSFIYFRYPTYTIRSNTSTWISHSQFKRDLESVSQELTRLSKSKCNLIYGFKEILLWKFNFWISIRLTKYKTHLPNFLAQMLYMNVNEQMSKIKRVRLYIICKQKTAQWIDIYCSFSCYRSFVWHFF